jgi:hypothetical protein
MHAPWYTSEMDTSPIPMPPELRSALNSHGGQPLHIWDEQSQKAYLLIEQNAPPVDDGYVRQLLAEAHEDIELGEVGPWNPDEVKAEGRRLFEQRRAKREG